MKKFAFIIIYMLIVIGCSTTKKAIQTHDSLDVLTEKNESEASHVEQFIDTTKTDKKKITITEIEFYPPNTTQLKIDNIAIKSIKQTTIERNLEQKGESDESSSSISTKNESVSANIENTAKFDEAPATDPYKWRYIFYILLAGVVAFLYFKRIPILNYIKKFISNI